MPIQPINDGVGVTIKGAKKVARYLDRSKKATDKALHTAVKVEGFRMMRLLKKQIKQGRPGNRALAPLSFIGRRLDRKVGRNIDETRRQSPNRPPMTRMAQGIKYRIKNSHPFSMTVGFVAPTGRSQDHKQGSWRHLARQHAMGFTRKITPELRGRVIRKGGVLGKIEGGDSPFFLKRSTRRFRTPARPLVEPFWQANQMVARMNIDRNFKRKLRGERI